MANQNHFKHTIPGNPSSNGDPYGNFASQKVASVDSECQTPQNFFVDVLQHHYSTLKPPDACGTKEQRYSQDSGYSDEHRNCIGISQSTFDVVESSYKGSIDVSDLVLDESFVDLVDMERFSHLISACNKSDSDTDEINLMSDEDNFFMQNTLTVEMIRAYKARVKEYRNNNGSCSSSGSSSASSSPRSIKRGGHDKTCPVDIQCRVPINKVRISPETKQRQSRHALIRKVFKSKSDGKLLEKVSERPNQCSPCHNTINRGANEQQRSMNVQTPKYQGSAYQKKYLDDINDIKIMARYEVPAMFAYEMDRKNEVWVSQPGDNRIFQLDQPCSVCKEGFQKSAIIICSGNQYWHNRCFVLVLKLLKFYKITLCSSPVIDGYKES